MGGRDEVQPRHQILRERRRHGDQCAPPPSALRPARARPGARDPTGPARTLSQEILLTAAQGPTLALISGRTADNPKLLKEVIEAGCTHVYLEKPGAPTVAELEEMKAYAAEKGVPVYMGYNKNVTPYVRKALEEIMVVDRSEHES